MKYESQVHHSWWESKNPYMWEPHSYHCVDHSDLVVKLYFVVFSAKQRNLLTIMYEELNKYEHFRMLFDT